MDTLAEWLYNHYYVQQQLSVGWDFTPWPDLTPELRTVWEDEARTIRKAVDRDGFKDYDPDHRRRRRA